MATKKFKAPEGMNPEDAKDWEEYGSFVHHDVGGGAFLGPDGKPLDLTKYLPKKKAKPRAKKKTTAKKTTAKKTK